MSDLSKNELEELWENAGGSASVADLMAQIALDQSSGNPDAINNDAYTVSALQSKGWPVPSYGEHSFTSEQAEFDYPIQPEYSEGLWQANEYASGGNYYGYTPEELYNDPQAQADAAVAAYNTQGLGAWEGDPALSGYSSTTAPAEGSSISSQNPNAVTTVSKQSQYDFFTQGMITLNKFLNPSSTNITAVLSLEIAPTLQMVLSRGVLVAGFVVFEAAALLGVLSGGKLSGGDLPGLVAGFVAGPEIGAANAFRKLGVTGISSAQPSTSTGELTPAQQARLELQTKRENRLQEKEASSQQRNEKNYQLQTFRSKTFRREVARRERLTDAALGPVTDGSE